MRRAYTLLFVGLALGAGASSAPPDAPKRPALAFPIACRIGETCEIQNYVDVDPGPGAKDYRCGTQTYDKHGGVDFRIRDMAAQRAGVNVLAAAPGRVSRLRDGVADISVKSGGAPSVANQECGNGVVVDHGDGWETQYCHMARGSLAVKVGSMVTVGQPLGQVGLSGETEYPHLHLTVRHNGRTVDPFAPDAAPGLCTARGGRGLWSAAAARSVAYKQGAVLNAGFTDGPPAKDALEQGRLSAPSGASPALVAFVRAISLQAGDHQTLVLKDSTGSVLAQSQIPELDHGKAQYVLYVGQKRPAAGWKPGVYVASYTVVRGGAVAFGKSFQIEL